MPVLQHQRMLDILVEPKAVRLQIRTVRAGREQVHGDVVRAVAGDGKIERLRQPRDLHEGGDAAAIGDVRLGIGHRAGDDVVLELPQRAQILARRDRHAAGLHDAGMARDIVGDDRLFEPGEVVGLERAGGANRFLDRPFHVGIHHQRKAVAEMLAHRRDPRDIRFQIRPADLHLDGAKALGEIAVGLLQQRLDGEIEVDAAGIAGHARDRIRRAAATAANSRAAPSNPTARCRAPRAPAPPARRGRRNAGPTRR